MDERLRQAAEYVLELLGRDTRYPELRAMLNIPRTLTDEDIERMYEDGTLV